MTNEKDEINKENKTKNDQTVSFFPPQSQKRSPPRKALTINAGLTSSGANPELLRHLRTEELATDQSIAARNLLYHPNQSSLHVIKLCAEGINDIMKRLNHGLDVELNLHNDEILISLCTRLMANGGAARIDGFNERLNKIVHLQKVQPSSEKYFSSVQLLATECRVKMDEITRSAVKEGPEGALARQGILSFMGDLGGLETADTGYGAGYLGPLCDPKDIYHSYVAGLCDTQRRLIGLNAADPIEVLDFAKEFHDCRAATSIK